MTPDAGIDLVVTNIARSRFLKEASRSINVQVKSTMMAGVDAKFWITDEELKFLCGGEQRYTVFAIFHDLQKDLDFDNFDVYTDQIQRLIDLDLENFCKESKTKEQKRNIFEFTKYSITLFWLNSKQMQRSRGDGLWKYAAQHKKWYLPVSTEDGILSVDNAALMPALQEVRYMMIPCLSQNQFDEGRFSYDHI